jgi:phi13 family phage major tail protein
MANKVKYGLKNVHYAVITNTDGVVSYATPVAIPGAVALSLSPLGDKTTFYADDSAYFVANANNGYEGSLEIALVPDQFKKDILGYLEDTNGALVEDSAAVAKDFALLFEFSGDVNATRHVLYNVNAARPNIESGTKGESLEIKPDTLEITASPAIDTGYVKAKLESTATGYDDFYKSVYVVTMSVIIPVEGD